MKKSLHRTLVLAILAALILGVGPMAGVSAASNTYYVSTAGSDTNPGTSAAPFKTFAKAVSVLQAGDTLQVMAGTYTETLKLTSSGADSAPITLTGNRAVLNMQGVNQNGITISGSNVRVSGFEVAGATSFGIMVTGKNVTVENNVFHDNVTLNGVGTCGLSSSWGSALKVGLGGANTTIRGNTVYNNCGEGIAVTRGVTALVENNTTYDNFSVNIYVDNSPYVTVRGNLSYCTGTHLRNGNRASAIALGEEFYSGWGAQLHDVTVSGNTLKDCSNGVAVYQSDVNGTLSNVTITGNSVPSGQVRGISMQTVSNLNVLISYNTLFNPIYMAQSAGITLLGNTVGSVAPTSTAAVPSATPTSLPPSPTVTASPLPASPTPTSLPPSPTASTVPASPTPSLEPLTPSATPFVPAPGMPGTVYDDKNSSIAYSSGWKNVSASPAYGGSYKQTGVKGSYATLTFTGQSFSILYRSGTNFRKMAVYVDGVLVGTIDQKAASSRYQLRWDAPGLLSPGSHTLKLVFVTTKSSTKTYGSFDAVIVQ